MTNPERRRSKSSTGRRTFRSVSVSAATALALILAAAVPPPTYALSNGSKGTRNSASGSIPSSPPPPSSSLWPVGASPDEASAVAGSGRRNKIVPPSGLSKRRVFLAKGAITAATSAAVIAGNAVASSASSSSSSSSSSSASSSSTIRPPDKKSTASDVVSYLRRTDHLAPYVSSGGTAIVTGGNSGIGLETVAALASAGMNVLLCCRRTDAGLLARDSLPESVRENVTVIKMDLADMTSVTSSAKDIMGACGERGVDTIVNNAGVADKAGPAQYTAQGLELQWGTNHVGHHLLTRLLLPSVNKGGRIVTVSSMAHFFASDTTEWGTGADGGHYSSPYCQSKLCNVLFAADLQSRLNLEGRSDVQSVSLHPGVISTPLFDGSTPVWKLIKMTADKTAQQGAATSTLCALVDEVEGGAFYDDCRTRDMSEVAKDAGGRRREHLWTRTEGVIRDNGIELPTRLT